MLGLLSTACVDQIVPVDPTLEREKTNDLHTITATLVSGETKTGLSESDIVWKTGDVIKVYSSSKPLGVDYTLTSGDNQTTATFSGEDIGSGMYYAVYPASGASGTLPTVYMNIPAVQKYAAGSFGAGANIAIAVGDDKNALQFHNVGGLLKLTIKGTGTITRINLYSRGNSQEDVLHGLVTVNNSTNPPTLTYPAFNETNGTVSLDCSEGGGVVLNDDPGVDFFFFLPTGSLAHGFQVEIIDNAGKAMIKNAAGDGSCTIERSVLRPMETPISYDRQYNSNFLTATSEVGVWTGVKADQSLVPVENYTALEAGNGQYSLISPHTVRFQNWSAGYAVTLTTSATPVLKGDVTIDVTKVGNTSVTPQTGLSVKVVKQFGGRSWLVDETGGNGYIIR